MEAAIASISSAERFSFDLLKLISPILFSGTKCTCAWGTSKPMTLIPILRHGSELRKAEATFFENSMIPDISSSDKSKK